MAPVATPTGVVVANGACEVGEGDDEPASKADGPCLVDLVVLETIKFTGSNMCNIGLTTRGCLAPC